MFHAETTEGRAMSVEDIAKLGKLLARFLANFACCFAGRMLLQVYVQGLLSDVQRKNVEAIALDQSPASGFRALARKRLLS
jgi:hypothetical protein